MLVLQKSSCSQAFSQGAGDVNGRVPSGGMQREVCFESVTLATEPQQQGAAQSSSAEEQTGGIRTFPRDDSILLYLSLALRDDPSPDRLSG